jgi:hypothetical protein
VHIFQKCALKKFLHRLFYFHIGNTFSKMKKIQYFFHHQQFAGIKKDVKSNLNKFCWFFQKTAFSFHTFFPIYILHAKLASSRSFSYKLESICFNSENIRLINKARSSIETFILRHLRLEESK